MATIVSAPSMDAASTPHSPTAPSPTTTAVPPWRTPDVTAACHPVGITSEMVSTDASSDLSGTPSVFTRLPSAWVTRAYSAWPLAVKPMLSQAFCAPYWQCGQVLSQWSNGTTTKSPGLNDRTSAPTSSMIPTHSWPIVSPSVI